MAYLHRDDRREVILLAAMRVALAEGFSAMTVRRVATEAGVATGQVHHHFSSASALKAQAFIRLIDALLEVEVVPATAPWRDQLHAMLGSDEGGLEPYVRLWREALLLASKDPEIKGAYLITLEMWHDKVVELIDKGRAAGEFTRQDPAQEIAWRLIAFVCGMDGICMLGLPDVDDAAFNRHLAVMITQALC
ncbi:TetR family transcriptional regulator [Kosakonia sp.]|uniref:TetR family transcriptional regulator n=1 Tax=Kosakonia sp. TaxID=1916651 RepID=UPI00289C14E3|nr:TetR family transcriptional regulator [Kosakonia sp.]